MRPIVFAWMAVVAAVAATTAAPPPTLAGIDVLEREGFAALRGRRVGLLTNHTGRSRDGRSTVDLLRRAPGVSLAALFSPEHGIGGTLDEDVPSSTDPAGSLPVYSLYGETKRPTAAMLAGLDAIVVDLQDVGVRFYTYAATMTQVMEEAAPRRIAMVVLDRPNPIGGEIVEGPAAAADGSLVAYFPFMPVRHGMTMGELARLVNGERGLGVDLRVVSMDGWRRRDWYDQTGLPWIGPSPNLRTLAEAALYPGIGALEWSNVSVGRGTAKPFEQIGAPWVDAAALAARLRARRLPGVRVAPVAFTPDASVYRGQECHGVLLTVTDRAALRPVRLGLEIAAALWAIHPSDYRMQNTDRLLGSRESLERVKAGEDPAVVARSWAVDEERWEQLREKYLLYE